MSPRRWPDQRGPKKRAPSAPQESAISRDARTNRRIRARELRVIGPEGEQLGILSLETALQRAMEAGLDLVEVQPMAKPPVCKIMDYGKFKYETKKRANEAKKKQVVVKLKEIKLRPRTDEHDYDVKLRQTREFLEEGHKVKVTIVFRGREIAHREIGQKQLQEMVGDLKDVATIEQPPRMEGKAMFMLLGAARGGGGGGGGSRPPVTHVSRPPTPPGAAAPAVTRPTFQAPAPATAPVAAPVKTDEEKA
jgi:translation initiation factor IF-3